MYKLLIVEDNPIQVETLFSFIDWESMGITEIKTAKNGEDGIVIYREFCPDIIITDVCMPKVNGVDMIEQVREGNQNVQVIFISAYDNFDYAKSALELSACGYLLKPFTPAELFETVKTALERIQKRTWIEEFEKNYAESLVAYREMFLYMLKNNSFPHYNHESFDNISKNLYFENYRSFIICKLQYENRESEDCFDNSLMILNTFRSGLFEKYSGTGILEDYNSILFLLYSQKESEEAFSDLTELLSDLRNKAAELADGIRIGISETFYDIKNIQTMYYHAEISLDNGYVPLKDNIFVYGDVEENTDFFSINDLRTRLELLKENYDEESVKRLIDDFYPKDIRNIISVKSVCFTFLTVLQIILIEYDININSIPGADVWETIENLHTLPEPKVWLRNIILFAFESISENSQNEHHKIIGDIKHYISENYASIHSIDQISEELHISTSYAKQMFKKYTGQTIFEYLTQTRIERAKKLLEDPYVKVYEVSSEVGYVKSAYFSELFKRHTGMTPQQFKKLHTHTG